MVLKNLLKYQQGGLTVERIQSVINKYGRGKSPFTAKDYLEVSKNTGVPVDLLLAQGIQESNLGTQGRAVRTRNVGNVGNTDNGAENHQDSWLNGLYREANLLKNEYKVSSAADVQRLISNDFIRPVKGGRYASASNYGSKVGNLLNTLHGKPIYNTGKKTAQNQTENYTQLQTYQPIPFIENTLPTQIQETGINFYSLPSDTQNTIIENQKRQEELFAQQVEADELEKQNFAIEQALKQKQLERQKLLSSIPQAQYIGDRSNLQVNPFTTLLQEEDQYMQQGGVTGFFNKYIQSPKYLERLNKSGDYLPQRTIQNRLNNINSIKPLNYVKEGESEYQDNFKNININKNEILNNGYNVNDIITHEYAHSAGAVEPNLFNQGYALSQNDIANIESRTSAMPKSDNWDDLFKNRHDRMPTEIKADVDTLRYLMQKDGIYDAGKEDFKKEHLDKINSKYKNNKIYQRLKNATKSDKDLMWIFNSIAYNTNNNKDSQI